MHKEFLKLVDEVYQLLSRFINFPTSFLMCLSHQTIILICYKVWIIALILNKVLSVTGYLFINSIE